MQLQHGKSTIDKSTRRNNPVRSTKEVRGSRVQFEKAKLMNKKKRGSLLQLYAPKPGTSINRVFQTNVLPRSSEKASKTRNIGLRTYTPPLQQQRIKQKYMDGMSIRQIAREENKARETVTKIVRAPDMDKIVEIMRQQMIPVMFEIGPALVRALKYSPDGGWLAFELAERWGAIRPKPYAICRHCGRRP